MDIVFHILVNISPIITIFLFWFFCKQIDKGKNLGATVSFWMFIIFIEAFPAIIKWGYGNIIIAVIMQSIYLLLYTFLMIYFIQDESSWIKSLFIFCMIFYIVFSLFHLYGRLKLENVLEIELVDKISDKLESIDYFKLFINIIENEWFKGIAIAALGGIIGGLILEQLNKRNK